jgi:hypothetical protein
LKYPKAALVVQKNNVMKAKSMFLAVTASFIATEGIGAEDGADAFGSSIRIRPGDRPARLTIAF